jgi:hypothetical protein
MLDVQRVAADEPAYNGQTLGPWAAPPASARRAAALERAAKSV